MDGRPSPLGEVTLATIGIARDVSSMAYESGPHARFSRARTKRPVSAPVIGTFKLCWIQIASTGVDYVPAWFLDGPPVTRDEASRQFHAEYVVRRSSHLRCELMPERARIGIGVRRDHSRLLDPSRQDTRTRWVSSNRARHRYACSRFWNENERISEPKIETVQSL